MYYLNFLLNILPNLPISKDSEYLAKCDIQRHIKNGLININNPNILYRVNLFFGTTNLYANYNYNKIDPMNNIDF